MQHFRVKFFVQPDLRPDLGAAIPVFHRWIQESRLEEMLIDVADYQHVPGGPGVLLVAHDAFYSLDQAEDRLGLLYTRRTELEGSTQEKLRHAFAAAARACAELEKEPEFAGHLVFSGAECEFSVNDRLLAPNTEETWNLLRPELHALLDSVWGAGSYRLARAGEARDVFRVSAQCETPANLNLFLAG